MLAVEMLSEPVVVPDIFASGLSHVEDLGDGNFRLVMYARQNSPYGGQEFIVVAKIILPGGAVLKGVRTAMTALGRQCCGGSVVRVTH